MLYDGLKLEILTMQEIESAAAKAVSDGERRAELEQELEQKAEELANTCRVHEKDMTHFKQVSFLRLLLASRMYRYLQKKWSMKSIHRPCDNILLLFATKPCIGSVHPRCTSTQPQAVQCRSLKACRRMKSTENAHKPKSAKAQTWQKYTFEQAHVHM